MPVYIPETESLAFVVSLLQRSSITGLDQATGQSVAVAVYNQVSQDAPVPYIRVGVTDTVNLEDEPFGTEFTPTAKTLHLMIDVFTEYEPSTLVIAAKVQALLQHITVTTDHFHGSTWLNSCDYFIENTGSPDRVLRRASIRIQIRLEPGA
jgi:hypothetical protein